jgi:hypothetical protein
MDDGTYATLNPEGDRMPFGVDIFVSDIRIGGFLLILQAPTGCWADICKVRGGWHMPCVWVRAGTAAVRCVRRRRSRAPRR